MFNSHSYAGLMKSILLPVIGLLFLSSCATSPVYVPVHDRFGILKIDIPSDYFDDTKSYLNDIETVRVARGKPADPAIKSLLMIRRNDGNANCKFRELRYFPNENGYRWEPERLANEVSIVFNNMFVTYEMVDYLKLGIAAPIGKKNSTKTERISSSPVTVNSYTGWQTTYSHKTYPPTGFKTPIVLTKTVVIKRPVPESPSAPKFYIVVECGASGAESNALVSIGKITELLNSMQFL